MPLQENVFAKKALKMSSLQSFENAFTRNFENVFATKL